MWRRIGITLAAGVLAACPGEQAQQEREAASRDGIAVHQDAEARETSYSIVSGNCRITWVVYRSDLNRGVIRHRADCGLAPGQQAPLIGKLLAKVMESDEAAGDFRTLSWGRLHPDRAQDATLAARLALAAKRSKEWDAAKGRPRGGDINGWVRELANEASIYRELQDVFRRSGLEIRLSSVEKVLVLKARQLPFYEGLRAEGVGAGDRVPFDCQAWFSVRRMDARERGGNDRDERAWASGSWHTGYRIESRRVLDGLDHEDSCATCDVVFAGHRPASPESNVIPMNETSG